MSDRNPAIEVAAGVLRNPQARILLSLRHPESHQGGLWEFPGGKLDPGESVEAALKREFLEELDVRVESCSPLIRISHDYGDKSVILHVWEIHKWSGTPRGVEGQPLRWAASNELRTLAFPEANLPIVRRLNAPKTIAITPDTGSVADLLQIIEQQLARQPDCILVRQTQLSGKEYLEWFRLVQEFVADRSMLLFHQALELFSELPVQSNIGYHANAGRLQNWKKRPLSNRVCFSASCHDQAELQHAEALGVDLALLSPVHGIAKYGGRPGLGWDEVGRLSRLVATPVYALGGVALDELPLARQHGATGIAGIRTFLN